MLLRGQFWVENESKVPGRIREGDVVWAKSNWVREGNGRSFQGRRKGKEKTFCFVVKFELILGHPCFDVAYGKVGHFTERSGFPELCVVQLTHLCCMSMRCTVDAFVMHVDALYSWRICAAWWCIVQLTRLCCMSMRCTAEAFVLPVGVQRWVKRRMWAPETNQPRHVYFPDGIVIITIIFKA